jgi:hypothetical protein
MAVSLDYLRLSERYRPRTVTTLLVGEAPPPGGESYFYLPARLKMTADIRTNRSLPATIFYRYFKSLPRDPAEYESMLIDLKNNGVFLIDICDEPIKVRDNRAGLQRIKDEIPRLRRKMTERKLNVPDEAITFLLARPYYKQTLKAHFPVSTWIRWIDFRMGR